MLRLVLSIMVTTLMIAANVAFAQTSSGTAFAVAPEILVTNQHVVAGCSSIEIVSADGRRKGSVVATDADIDLAVLRVGGLKGPTARLRNPRTIRLGESVMVFGFPLTGALSSDGNFTSGVVSALRGLRDATGEVQITAPVQPGNSGGPLLDASGLVIGVIEAKLDTLRTAKATGDIPQNVNFAISLEVLAAFLSKNKVSFRDAAVSPPLDPARVAELAQSFTHRIECLGRPQQATTSPSSTQAARESTPMDFDEVQRRADRAKKSQLPDCRGTYSINAWTNCFGSISDLKIEIWRFQQYPKPSEYGMSTLLRSLTLVEVPFYIGGTYSGEFKDGKPHGKGAVRFDGDGTYSGEFKDGKRDGQGIYEHANGEKYVGEVKNGRRNGQGTFALPDGRKYVGEFRDDKMHGQGIEYRAGGSVLRSGVWEDGVFVRSQ